jgi:hypothetical protein
MMRKCISLPKTLNGFKVIKDLGMVPNKNENKRRQAIFECKHCGNEFTAVPTHVASGIRKGCGCTRKHSRGTVGSFDDPYYRVWKYIHRECKRTTSKFYKQNIAVCDEWNDFETFKKDMGPKPKPTYSLFRKDYKKGFCKDNCMWLERGTFIYNKEPKSPYVGVNWFYPSNKWYTCIQVRAKDMDKIGKKIIYVGYYADPVEAAKARNKKVKEYGLDDSYLNDV